MAPGDQHRYQVVLAPGQWAGLRVEQRGIQVTVELLGPDGGSLATFNDEVRPSGEQEIAFVAETGGTYTLVATAKIKGTPSGSYSIRFGEMRPATDSDRSLFEARKLQSQATSLLSAGKHAEALPVVERALDRVEKTKAEDQVQVAP